MTTIAAMPEPSVLAKKITWQEFRDMDFPENDPFIYELIHGEIVKKSAPKPLHQLISQRIEFQLATLLRETPLGQYFHAPVDVFLDDDNGVQPDICYLQKDRLFLLDLNDGILGAPDLIVEIVSPGSVKLDRVSKKDLYERFAVREYWLVDPNNKTVEIYVMQQNAYALHQFLEAEGKAESTVLPGLEIDVQALFGNP